MNILLGNIFCKNRSRLAPLILYLKLFNIKNVNLSLFGDASTCSLVTNEHEKNSWSLSNSYFGSDGKGSDFIKIQNNILKMDGKSVFNFASNTVINDLKTYLNFPYSEYYFLFHQANSFMLNYLRKKMKIPNDKFLIDMENTGNTVSSSIPLVLSKNIPNKIILV
ncbi:hypothetical protein N9E55_05140, partial [Flavobacteriaceae bacterium]|nr:hypothetical protein [Flavobacteriaceae bacterium]